MTSATTGNWGIRFGVLTPATNLTVEEELWSMRVDGATVATARITIDQVDWKEPEDIVRFVEGVKRRIPDAITHVRQMSPDALVLGISISVLWGGSKGNAELKRQVKAETGLELFTAVDAIAAGIKTLGLDKIAVVTPYPELADKPVLAFFDALGVRVLAQKSLRAPSAGAIGDIQAPALCQAMKDACVPGTQAVVTLGTDLKISSLAAQAENWLGVPAVAVNAATWWHALRSKGIRTQLREWGPLLRDH